MSYTIWLEVDVGGPEPAELDVLPYWNYTSNVARMWRKAMPDTDGLAGLHGMECADAAAALRRGVAAMEADPDPYRQMDPENGWGDFESQLDKLKELLAACERAPRARVGISA